MLLKCRNCPPLCPTAHNTSHLGLSQSPLFFLLRWRSPVAHQACHRWRCAAYSDRLDIRHDVYNLMFGPSAIKADCLSLTCTHRLIRLFCSQLVCGQVSHSKHTLELVLPSAVLEMIYLAGKVAFSGQAASWAVHVRQG